MYRLSQDSVRFLAFLSSMQVDEMRYLQGSDEDLTKLYNFIRDIHSCDMKDPRARSIEGWKFRTLRSLRRDLNFNESPKLYIIRVK